MVFFEALVIVFAISVLGIAGGLLLIWREKLAKLFSMYFINFAIGALLGVVFLDLLPEALRAGTSILTYSLVGMLVFYLLEKTLLWYHHHSVEHITSHKKRHHPDETIHPAGYLITLGDSLHNFIDGLVIAAGFLIDFRIGITTSLAVLFHELPQEMGEFAILLHAKFTRAKIILYSLFAQMTAVAGFLLGFHYFPLFEGFIPAVLAFASGGFIYIASTDLLPETHREKKLHASLLQVLLIILGVLVIFFVGNVLPE